MPMETGRTHQIRAHKTHGHPLFKMKRWRSFNFKGTTFTKYKQFIDNCFKALRDKRYMLKH
jgi:23S rRNA pseudouridine1911/1915/1917 synthase